MRKLRVLVGLDVKAEEHLNREQVISNFTKRMGMFRECHTEARYNSLFDIFVEAWACCPSKLDRSLAYNTLKDILCHWPSQYKVVPRCFYGLLDDELKKKIAKVVLHDDSFGTLEVMGMAKEIE